MPKAERSAEVKWEGTLAQGKGVINGGSGALKELPVTWAARVESSDGKTSPEELLAAAQASCYAMALSANLARNHTPPTNLEVKATCTIDQVEGGFAVTSMHITVKGTVADIDEGKFKQLADETSKGCPISKAIINNVAINVHATLQAG